MDEDQAVPVPRDERGRWLEQPPNSKQITSATARTMAEKRWKKAREKVRLRVTEEMQGFFPSVTTPEDAYAEIVAKQAVSLMDYDKPRMDEVDKLGQIMGARPDAQDLKQDATPVQQTTELLTAAARLLELVKDNIPAIQVIDIRNDIDGIVE